MFLLTPFKNNDMSKKNNFLTMFDDFFNDSMISMMHSSFRLDVREDDNAYYIEADLPGIKKEEIELQYLDDKRLVIAVKQEEQNEEEKENYLHKERRMSSMQRSIYLQNIDSDEITAKLEDGVLKVRAPKVEKSIKQRTIEIK